MCVRVRVGVPLVDVHGLDAFENKNKPVSVPNIGGHQLCFLFGKALSKLQLQFQLYTIARIIGHRPKLSERRHRREEMAEQRDACC